MLDGAHLATGLMNHAEEILATRGILDNPYFTSLQSGEMSVEEFQRSQQQFYFAVAFFSRPMSAAMMRLPCGDQRLGILENIIEEHGNMRSQAFHEATFRRFLGSIGCDQQRPVADDMEPAVHAFNATILSACLNDDVRTGIACLGIIEYAFADISALIGKAVIDRGMVQEGRLLHYKLHAKIDKQHAADFFRLIENSWTDKQSRQQINQGLRLGAYAFDRLYRDLIDSSLET